MSWRIAKRLLDIALLMAMTALVALNVIGVLLFDSIRIVEDSWEWRTVDVVCVVGVFGYAIYRFAELVREP